MPSHTHTVCSGWADLLGYTHGCYTFVRFANFCLYVRRSFTRFTAGLRAPFCLHLSGPLLTTCGWTPTRSSACTRFSLTSRGTTVLVTRRTFYLPAHTSPGPLDTHVLLLFTTFTSSRCGILDIFAFTALNHCIRTPTTHFRFTTFHLFVHLYARSPCITHTFRYMDVSHHAHHALTMDLWTIFCLDTFCLFARHPTPGCTLLLHLSFVSPHRFIIASSFVFGPRGLIMDPWFSSSHLHYQFYTIVPLSALTLDILHFFHGRFSFLVLHAIFTFHFGHILHSFHAHGPPVGLPVSPVFFPYFLLFMRFGHTFLSLVLPAPGYFFSPLRSKHSHISLFWWIHHYFWTRHHAHVLSGFLFFLTLHSLCTSCLLSMFSASHFLLQFSLLAMLHATAHLVRFARTRHAFSLHWFGSSFVATTLATHLRSFTYTALPLDWTPWDCEHFMFRLPGFSFGRFMDSVHFAVFCLDMPGLHGHISFL